MKTKIRKQFYRMLSLILVLTVVMPAAAPAYATDSESESAYAAGSDLEPAPGGEAEPLPEPEPADSENLEPAPDTTVNPEPDVVDEADLEPAPDNEAEPVPEPEPTDSASPELNPDAIANPEPDIVDEIVLEPAPSNEADPDTASAYASTTSHVTALYLVREITSRDSTGKNASSEEVDLTWGGKSLCFLDSSDVRQVISTQNSYGASRHYKDEVTVRVRLEGQPLNHVYTRINGENVSISEPTLELISSSPKILEYTYKVQRIWDEPYTIFTVGYLDLPDLEPSTTPIYTRYETNVYIWWNTDGRAEAPNISFVYDEASDKMILSGADSTMQYRVWNATSSWAYCTDEPMYFDCAVGSNISYLVRYAPVGDSPASQTREIILPARRSAPNVSYSKSTEILSGLNTSMELRLNDGPYEAVTETSMSLADIIDAIPADSTATIGVRYKGTAADQSSAEKKITLYPRSETPVSVTFDPISLTLSGYTTAMEYRADSDTSWKSMSGTSLSLQSYAQGDRDVVIYVRTKSTNTTSASRAFECTIPQLAASPAARLDYTAEALVGLSNGNYQYSTNGTSWTALTVVDNQWNISSLIGSSAKTLYLRWAATDTTPISAATVFTLPARPSAPSTPAFDYSVTGLASLTGVTTEMQYKKSTDAEWIDISSNNNIFFEIPAASTTYYVRLKATDQSFVSTNKTVTLSKAGTAPSCTYNTTTELISSLSTAMEMKIGNGTYTPITETTFSTSELIDRLPSGGSMEIRVRTMATTNAPASAEKVFTIYARSAAPSTLVYNTGANSLSGCSSSMQYRLEGSTGWTSISGTTLSLQSKASTEKDVKVYVRMKPTSTAAASTAVEFTIPQMLPGPVGTINCLNESITGLSNGNYQYSTNATSWTNLSITDGKWDISSLISTSAKTLYLRRAATETTPITNYSTFKIAARPTAPSSISFDYSVTGQATLTGVTTEMEYRLSTATEWISVTGAPITFYVPTSSATYYVRYKSTEQNFASANRSVTLSKAGTAPKCSYSTTTELISAMSTAMEIKIGNRAFTPVTETTFSTSELIDGLPSGGSMEIWVRTMATANAPASAEKVFTIYARSAAPSTLVYNTGTNSLSGCSSSMQYRLEDSTGWTSISGTTLSLQSKASAEKDVKVYVRMKPTSTAAASRAVEFTIPQMLPGPAGTINYSQESITGIPNGTYQYSLNKTSWTTLTITNRTWDISALLTSSARTLYLRGAATDTTPITDSTAFSIAARPAAPSTPVFVYNDPSHPGMAVLTGVTPDMQYKSKTDTLWTNITGDQVILEVPDAATTYYVRIRSNSDSWASSNKTLTLAKRAAAPSCTYSAKTELISGVKTTMEISIGGAPYVPIESGTTYDMSSIVDTLSGTQTIQVIIRVRATATAPASQIKVLTIGART